MSFSSALLIPLKQDTPFFSVKATLDGVEYVLDFEWNMRSGWYMGLSDRLGVRIFGPRKVVENWNLLASHYHDPRTPRGLLVAIDLDGAGRPGYNDFVTQTQSKDLDGRIQLTYYTED